MSQLDTSRTLFGRECPALEATMSHCSRGPVVFWADVSTVGGDRGHATHVAATDRTCS
jgi:hypothetical protein